MLHVYHESDKEENNLDSKPLLSDLKLNELIKNESKPIFVNECNWKKKNIINEKYHISLSPEIKIIDENDNLIEITEISKETIYGLYVVAFDTKYGNVIEWQIPQSLNLENVEFKAMASGLHLMENDLVFFFYNGMFSLAVFKIFHSDNPSERNVRMKSVGVLGKSFKQLRNYVPILRAQIKSLLEQPCSYDDLIDLWHNKTLQANLSKSVLIPSNMIQNSDFVLQKTPSEKHIYTRFCSYFGPALFSLWRCVLLNKRILFFSMPPIEDLCYRVYCASQLGNTSFNFASSKQLIKPYFYVNVMDIESLQAEPFYLACTTEKILLNKENLFDMFVEDKNIKAVLIENQKNLLRINSSDKKKFDLLMKRLNKGTDLNCNDEDIFLDFFTELNDQLFSTLFEAENAEIGFDIHSGVSSKRKETSCIPRRQIKSQKRRFQTKVVQNEIIKRAGLDPSDEKEFLSEVLKFYDFNLKVS